jgi:formate dehydrogenase subunit delta
MNIDLLIKMANEIGDFFAGTTADPQQAARDVASHLRRFWEPRMRAQMLRYYEQRQGAGLSDVARGAVAMLAAAANVPPAGAPAPSAPAAGSTSPKA